MRRFPPALPAPAGLPLPRRRPRRGRFPQRGLPRAARPPGTARRRLAPARRRGGEAAVPGTEALPRGGRVSRRCHAAPGTGRAGRGSATWIRFLCLRRSAMLSPSAPPVTCAGAGRRAAAAAASREVAGTGEGAGRPRRASPSRRAAVAAAGSWAALRLSPSGSPGPSAGAEGSPARRSPRWVPACGPPRLRDVAACPRGRARAAPPRAAVWLIRNWSRGRCSLCRCPCPRLSRGARAPSAQVQLQSGAEASHRPVPARAAGAARRGLLQAGGRGSARPWPRAGASVSAEAAPGTRRAAPPCRSDGAPALAVKTYSWFWCS